MANISQYLQAIMDAVKGDEVRGSIHDAIQAINTENVNLNRTIRSSVQMIVDNAIERSSAIEERIETYLDEDIFYILFDYDEDELTLTVNHSDLEVSAWLNESLERDYFKIPAYCYIHGSTFTNYIKLDVNDGVWSATYFNYSGNDIYLNYIELSIFGENALLNDSKHVKIYPQSGGSSGGDSEAFIMQFTLDSNKNVTCNRSSTEAEEFMDNKYGSGNWTWDDFWKEAVITLYNEYEAWDYGSGTVDSSPEVVMSLSHIDLADKYLYFSTDYVGTNGLEVDDHHTYVEFEWDLNSWTTSDTGNDVECKIYGGLEAGTGIDISQNNHLPGTGIVTNVISLDSNIVPCDYAKFNNMGEIVLPILVDKNYRQTIDFTCDNYATNNVILGSQYSELMHITQYGNKYYIRKNLSDNAQLSLSLTGRHTFIHSPTEYVKFDDNIVVSDINFSRYTNAGEHYVLGARNSNNMSSEPNYKYSNIKVHEYTLTDTADDTVLCHLIPAKYEIGGVVLSSGLYDTVNKQFYTCNGLTIGNIS